MLFSGKCMPRIVQYRLVEDKIHLFIYWNYSRSVIIKHWDGKYRISTVTYFCGISAENIKRLFSYAARHDEASAFSAVATSVSHAGSLFMLLSYEELYGMTTILLLTFFYFNCLRKHNTYHNKALFSMTLNPKISHMEYHLV